MDKIHCQNMNHRRSDAPVRVCPNCGDVVNSSIAQKKCSDEDHAEKRRKQSRFCCDCGAQLIGA